MSHIFTTNGTLNWERVLKLFDSPPRKFIREHSPHHNSFLTQRFIVLHYTAGGSMAGTIDWFNNPDSNVSSHFIIDRNGDLAQCVSCDSRAWHCGESTWNGLKGMNQFSIGIELCNWGPLKKDLTDGLFYPWHAKEKTAPIPAARVTEYSYPRQDSIFRYWESYPGKQLASLSLLILALCRTYMIEDVLSHNEIAPTRKIDPGPVFPLQLFKDFAKIAGKIE